MKMIKKNECEMGNPQPGEVDGQIGSGDRWDNNVINNKKSKKMKKPIKTLAEASGDIVDEFDLIASNCSIHGLFASLYNYLNVDQKRDFFTEIIKDYNFYEDEDDYEFIINADVDTQLDRIYDSGWDSFSILNEFIIYASNDLLKDFVEYLKKEHDIDTNNYINESYDGYSDEMIAKLIDNGNIYSAKDAPEYIDNYCLLIYADSPAGMAREYIDNFDIDVKSLMKKTDLINYTKLGREYKFGIHDDEYEELLATPDKEFGDRIVNQFYGGFKYFVNDTDVKTLKNILDYDKYADILMSTYDFICGVDNEGNGYYILIFE